MNGIIILSLDFKIMLTSYKLVFSLEYRWLISLPAKDQFNVVPNSTELLLPTVVPPELHNPPHAADSSDRLKNMTAVRPPKRKIHRINGQRKFITPAGTRHALSTAHEVPQIRYIWGECEAIWTLLPRAPHRGWDPLVAWGLSRDGAVEYQHLLPAWWLPSVIGATGPGGGRYSSGLTGWHRWRAWEVQVGRLLSSRRWWVNWRKSLSRLCLSPALAPLGHATACRPSVHLIRRQSRRFGFSDESRGENTHEHLVYWPLVIQK